MNNYPLPVVYSVETFMNRWPRYFGKCKEMTKTPSNEKIEMLDGVFLRTKLVLIST